MSSYSILKQNQIALSGQAGYKKWQNTRPRLCWSCQKEKQTTGGKIKTSPGFFKFVCKECIESKQKKES